MTHHGCFMLLASSGWSLKAANNWRQLHQWDSNHASRCRKAPVTAKVVPPPKKIFPCPLYQDTKTTGAMHWYKVASIVIFQFCELWSWVLLTWLSSTKSQQNSELCSLAAGFSAFVRQFITGASPHCLGQALWHCDIVLRCAMTSLGIPNDEVSCPHFTFLTPRKATGESTRLYWHLKMPASVTSDPPPTLWMLHRLGHPERG